MAHLSVIAELPAVLPNSHSGPAQADLDRCVHCGLCLNACPTYRELGVEMDSPRGRIYLMNQVAAGAAITPAYKQHLDLCLACRGCETACPSGVPYGRMIEAARAQIRHQNPPSGWKKALNSLIFRKLLRSRTALQIAGTGLFLYQASGLQRLIRATHILRLFGQIADVEALSPDAEIPFFYSNIGKTFAPVGPKRYRVAFLSGCIANVSFARLNEATVRVLQKNGCEVLIPDAQNCCGALHLHSGLDEQAQALARNNIDAVLEGEFNAIITNAAGCGSTLKEYDALLQSDPAYAAKAVEFKRRMRDITEFLASIDLNQDLGPIPVRITYQDSCHLAHGQGIRSAPRKLLKMIPQIELREMPMADLCCGSAGIYNVVQNPMAMEILRSKMRHVETTDAGWIVTANPGCMLQLRAGARLYGKNQRVLHVVEVLDESYRNFQSNPRFETSAAIPAAPNKS